MDCSPGAHDFLETLSTPHMIGVVRIPIDFANFVLVGVFRNEGDRCVKLFPVDHGHLRLHGNFREVSFFREIVRDLLGDLTGDESLPEASIIMQGPCPRRFPCVAIRRLGFIGFSSDQKPQSLVE